MAENGSDNISYEEKINFAEEVPPNHDEVDIYSSNNIESMPFTETKPDLSLEYHLHRPLHNNCEFEQRQKVHSSTLF